MSRSTDERYIGCFGTLLLSDEVEEMEDGDRQLGSHHVDVQYRKEMLFVVVCCCGCFSVSKRLMTQANN